MLRLKHMEMLFDRLAPALQSLGRAGPRLLSGTILLTHRPSLSKSSWELAPRYVIIPVSCGYCCSLGVYAISTVRPWMHGYSDL
jgi:hypothetical protein